MSVYRQSLLVVATAAVVIAMPLMGSTASRPVVIFVDDDNCPGPGSGSEADPYCSIQTAIDNAMDTDEIVVAPGPYFETINFLGKAITLRGFGPLVTIIDAQQTGSVVTCDSREGRDTVLKGFNIRGGTGTETGDFFSFQGGGMYIDNSSPTVANCIFSENTADSGGGMYVVGGKPTLTGVSFVDNGTGAGRGGGLQVDVGATVTIDSCMFLRNRAFGHDGEGGGLSVESGGIVHLSNCLIDDNQATFAGGGVSSRGDVTLVHCRLRGNLSDGGGGVQADGGTAAIINCEVSGNSGLFGGGGILGSRLLVVSTTIAANNAFFGSAISGSGIYVNCIFWGNVSSKDVIEGQPVISFSDVEGGWPGTGNIDADPLFVDPVNGDLHLQPGSVCIDAGHNWAIAGITATDLDGNSRFVHARGSPHPGCGVPAVVDMGAYEFPKGRAADIKLGDIDGNGTVGMFDLVSLVISWGPAGSGCQLADFDLDGIVAVPDLLTLLANWG